MKIKTNAFTARLKAAVEAAPIRRLLLTGTGIELLLCLLLILSVCSACESPVKAILAWSGLVFYAGAFLLVVLKRATPQSWAFAAAFAVHTALALTLLTNGHGCPLCVVAAVVATVNLSLACLSEPKTIQRCGVSLLSFGVVVTLLVRGAGLLSDPVGPLSPLSQASPGSQADSRSVLVTVYEKPGCRYCERLKNKVIPQIKDPLVTFRFRDAASQPLVVRVPFLVLQSRSDTRVLDGLPTAQILRTAIDQLRRSNQ